FAMLQNHAWGDSYTTWTGILPPQKEIAQCFIRLKCKALGCFGLTAADGSLDFPADGSLREFFVTGWEYLAAKETGHLKEVTVLESVTFNEHRNFGDYVRHFYDLKSKLDRKSAEYLYAKLFLNSLYGKFAANPERYRNYFIIPAKHVPFLLKDRLVKFEGWDFEGFIGSTNQLALISKVLADDQRRNYNVATAASITGCVRAIFWRAAAGADGLFYGDTDGIFAEKLNVKVSNELGDWKEEPPECGHGYNRVAIAGKKLYALWCGKCRWTGFDDEGRTPKGWKIASKGVKISGPEIFEIARGKEITWKKDAPSFSLKLGAKFLSRTIRKTG
ncbi:MAG TPA: DNA polymerase, partial [Terriglobales bacterium]|nr:DNA polymerase [Terriglobales bacterium]